MPYESPVGLQRILAVSIVIAPIILALIALTAVVAPRLIVRGDLAAVVYYLFFLCSIVGFFGSLVLAAVQRRLLWLTGTISTVLLFGLILLMSAGLAMSRWH